MFPKFSPVQTGESHVADTGQIEQTGNHPIPKPLSRAVLALIVTVLILVAYARLTDRPLEAQPPDGAIVSERIISMQGTQSGAALILDEEVRADEAMKVGVNYPAGPFEWLAQWSVPEVVKLLDALDSWYRGERYRVSPWLRLHAYPDLG